MPDQATELRQLVRIDAQHARPRAGSLPQLIAVAGGKGGVGTTTLAVNLATALARGGRATVLVDAHLEGADVASLCPVDERYTIHDLLAGTHSIHEVLCRGPGGVQLVPGGWGTGRLVEWSPPAQERLIASLRGLHPHAEFVVLDIGSGRTRIERRFWHAADKVLLVATPDPNAITNAYAAIKVLAEGDPGLPIYSLINLAPADEADDVHARLAQACQRFLGMRLLAAGHLQADSHVAAASRARQPFALSAPQSEAARLIELAAERITAAAPIDAPAPALMSQHNSENRFNPQPFVGR
jgi:flagellar biosynthesis protein FlhG